MQRGKNVCQLKLHTEKYFFESYQINRNLIVFTGLMWNKTEFHVVPNQSENGKYNLILVSYNKIQKRFLCVYNKSVQYIFGIINYLNIFLV